MMASKPRVATPSLVRALRGAARAGALAAVALAAGAAGCAAQVSAAGERVGRGSVTIVTDGMSQPDGAANRAIASLAASVSEVGRLRVLPVMGLGGPDNVRDLLHLRGVDFAVLNNDVLAYLDQTGEHAEARRKLRSVALLADKTVYLVARKPFAGVNDLTGRSVAVLAQGDGRVTFRALFGLLKVKAKALELEASSIDETSISGADAVLLVGEEWSRLRLQAPESWALLPIPLDPDPANVYRAATVARAEAPMLIAGESVSSVKVASILAVFDWKAGQARHQSVMPFIEAFFGSLADLRTRFPDGIWRGLDANAPVPDWENYRPADALRKAAPPPLPPAPAAVAPGQPPKSDAPSIRLVLSNRPPLSGVQFPGGGLIADIVASSLQAAMADGRIAKAPVENQGAGTVDGMTAVARETRGMTLPQEKPDCDDPGDLTRISAHVCDQALLSDPVFTVVSVLFSRADSGFSFAKDEDLAGRSICLPDSADASAFGRNGPASFRASNASVVTAPGLIECLSLVENREADAVLANELEGDGAIKRLGLSETFRASERSVGTQGLHAAVMKDNPDGAALIAALNAGVTLIKENGEYARIVSRHLSGAWKGAGNQ